MAGQGIVFGIFVLNRVSILSFCLKQDGFLGGQMSSTGYQNSEIFVLNSAECLRGWPAPPHPKIYRVPSGLTRLFQAWLMTGIMNRSHAGFALTVIGYFLITWFQVVQVVATPDVLFEGVKHFCKTDLRMASTLNHYH